jgi:hypothetical protein
MKHYVRTLILVAASAAASGASLAAPPHGFDERDGQEVRAVFLRQAAAATAHDIVAFEEVFASAPPGEPDPVTFVARAYQYWGRAALMDHFRETFRGVWKFEPDPENIKVIPMTADSAEIYAPTQVTSGSSDETAKTSSFLVHEVAVRTPEGWRIASIIPVPAK